ncbi:FxsA family protein [Paracoccus sanguinis]|uniref:Uncharacterized protein n=1 Tax=Paracoccus sanguinis TaxID=1545044 RepID=A0A099GJZ2_9RHOB|nr:FxsA family protein [Paracoccus sanguinis]KGJ22448.1 hypothetical protein IX56_07970 [Paracoccus sanguinis]
MWLLLAFLVLPIVEIALFIQMGGLIGLWPTIGLVVLSAVAGSWLMRQQGAAALADLQRAFRDLRDPTAPLAHGALILLAGALMVTPGFVTDLMGIALLIPAVRGWVIGRLGRRIRVAGAGFGYGGAGPAADWHRAGPPGGAPRGPYRGPDRGTVIDADYVVIDDDAAPPPPRPSGRPQPPSGWTRH